MGLTLLDIPIICGIFLLYWELLLLICFQLKFSIVEKFIEKAEFDNAKIVDIDGIRVEFEEGWGLLRASNTSPMLVLRFEAQTENDLKNIKDIFYKNLKSIEPDTSKF